ncbi:Bromodomain protein [Cordyceps fumosorosea ARSEF 2679]|uniref:Bromodomain protein n=1 Tax=Cordyceps fumosorosea (strain ARSEF 2679) TaxID=1081104 RepID=A0A167V1E1_CORFA|nr:Bromodomain protein [Cordyceps fumosorosea ARSEF 2679]OAA62119.1 Bromodomain protein [Cordyceps fumosorosea ARSEF 2679]
MDSKRKAEGGSGADSSDRSSKRRKVSDFDFNKGESKESTTAYGLAFLEQIRRTSDKSGRLIATYFEKLIPRQGNAEYYKKTRMPISLEIVEGKLEKGEFQNLAELESYFKRMITNAKEFYPRSSSVFDDAERFRKALSNYMTKNNPAYSKRGYQAIATPLPEEDAEAEGDEDDQEDQADESGDKQEEAEEEEVEKEEPEEEEEEEEEVKEEEEAEGPRRKSIILKRREEPAASRSRPRRSSAYLQASPKPATPAKPDGHQYEGVPYKGLTFQEAQEKIVEELLRHREPEYEEVYFEPFVNLPPRALKDYYRIVTDPLSLKKLQKIVKGIQGRGELTGVSELKSWAAFEEKSKLLWTNAYFYNEEGSEIYSLAQELQKMFNAQLKKAKAAVSEPAQSKIKLRVGGHGSSDTPSNKKITIHVGGRGNEESPASAPTSAPAQGTETPTTNDEGVNGAATPAAQVEDGTPASAPTPGQLPPGAPQPPGLSETPVPAPPPPPNPAQHNETRRPRGHGKGVNDALLSRLSILAHPMLQLAQPSMGSIYPDPKYLQQSGVINVPPHCTRVFVVTALPEFLHERHYSLWTLINRQPVKPYPQMIPGQQPQELAFEVGLHPGVNVVEAHLIAAIPGAQREAGGPESELEIFTAYVNVTRN